MTERLFSIRQVVSSLVSTDSRITTGRDGNTPVVDGTVIAVIAVGTAQTDTVVTTGLSLLRRSDQIGENVTSHSL